MKLFTLGVLLACVCVSPEVRADEDITGRVCVIDFDNAYSGHTLDVAWSCDGGAMKSNGPFGISTTDDAFAKYLSAWIKKFQDAGFQYAGCGGKSSLLSTRCTFIKSN